jgi:hypothetical protein
VVHEVYTVQNAEPGMANSITKTRTNQTRPCLHYCIRFKYCKSAVDMIYTGHMMFHQYLSPPRRCRRALPSCASAGAGAKDPSGLRRARGGQRVCADMRLAGVWGICAAFAGRAWLCAPVFRIASASLHPSLRNFDSAEQLPSMKDC